VLILLTPQIIAMMLIPLLATMGLVIPAVRMELHHFLYIFCMSTLFISMISLGASNWGSEPKAPMNLKITDSSIPFWICFTIGAFGTIRLLMGLGISSPTAYFYIITRDFNSLEGGFFNSSSAILWQANFAAFFWFNFVSKPNVAMKAALGLCLVFIFSRGALLYIIIAACYYLVSYSYLKSARKNLIMSLGFSFVFLQMVFLLSYTFSGNIYQIYFEKTYPYLSGNFVNLFRHIDMAFNRQLVDIESLDDLLQSMGLSSIRVYLDRYFGWEFQPDLRMVFFRQAIGSHVYGNTHTIYGQQVYLPLIAGIPYVIFLGILIGRVFRLAKENVFFLSVHCWFTAATFLSFAGAGHFTTTRFFPAMLFIWPIILFIASGKRTPASRQNILEGAGS
jgi:hypothetical protein